MRGSIPRSAPMPPFQFSRQKGSGNRALGGWFGNRCHPITPPNKLMFRFLLVASAGILFRIRSSRRRRLPRMFGAGWSWRRMLPNLSHLRPNCTGSDRHFAKHSVTTNSNLLARRAKNSSMAMKIGWRRANISRCMWMPRGESAEGYRLNLQLFQDKTLLVETEAKLK